MQEITRPLHGKEVNALKRLRHKMKKTLSNKVKWHLYFIALFIGVAGTDMALHLKHEFLQFLFTMLAICCFSYGTLVPYWLYRTRRDAKKKLKMLNILLADRQVKVTPVDALQIAVAEPFKHEKLLYIIAYELNKVLYFNDHGFGRAYPCLKFEIYEDVFFEATGRRIYPLSEKIEPLVISGKQKKAYQEKNGRPEHLTTESINFNVLVKAYLSPENNIPSNESN